MEHDYYQILGVAPAADLSVIQDAYRRRATQCHPDRNPGKSHEEMALVNEAWEVLSNAGRRRRYDAARANPHDTSSRQAAATDAQDARQRAGQYPRQWADMEELLNRVAADFTGAEHGSMDLGQGVEIPTAGKSVSGWVFILVGAILGGVLVSPVVYGLAAGGVAHTPPAMRNNGWLGLCLLVAVVAPVLAGAWAGAACHKWVGRFLEPSQRGRCPNPRCGSSRGWDGSRCRYCGATSAGQSAPDQPDGSADKRVIDCEKCHQKLRVPFTHAELLVTCKACEHKFACPPPACPKCQSPTGWNGRRCPWCGYSA